MIASETILGRIRNRDAFRKRKPFRVSVYLRYSGKGRYRYTDPVTSRAGPRILYRVIIRPIVRRGA